MDINFSLAACSFVAARQVSRKNKTVAASLNGKVSLWRYAKAGEPFAINSTYWLSATTIPQRRPLAGFTSGASGTEAAIIHAGFEGFSIQLGS